MSAGPSAQRIESAVAAASAAFPLAQPAPPPEPLASVDLDPPPQSFAEVIELFDKRREALLRSHLWSHCHLVAFEPGRIVFRPEAGAPRDLANRLGQLLGEWTGTRWIVAVSQAEGAPTLAEEEAQRAGELRNEVASHPLVRAVLDTFPGATIAAVRQRFVAGDSGAEPPADDIGADPPAAWVEDDGASATEDET
jgi:DNA polymerase-3 subunit gamma/tau